MRKQIKQTKTFIEDFKEIRKYQFMLNLLFVLLILTTYILDYFKIISMEAFKLTSTMLLIFSLALMFIGLCKQNQLFRMLKKIYTMSKRDFIEL